MRAALARRKPSIMMNNPIRGWLEGGLGGGDRIMRREQPGGKPQMDTDFTGGGGNGGGEERFSRKERKDRRAENHNQTRATTNWTWSREAATEPQNHGGTEL